MKKLLNYEEWVTTCITNIAEYFNLGGWTISVEFPEEAKGNSYAEATINHVYQNAIINIFPQAKKDFESKKLDIVVMALVHELVHVFLDPFHEFVNPHLSEVTTPYFMNIVEQQTQKLTMVFLKNLPQNIIPAR